MSIGHLSPQSTLPPLAFKTLNTTTWGSGGNTSTISDQYIKPNSQVIVQVTGSTPQSGFWSYVVSEGKVVITSSNSESSTLPLSYIVY